MKRKILGIGVGLALASLAMSESLTTTMSGQVTDLTGLNFAGVYTNATVATFADAPGFAAQFRTLDNTAYILYNPMAAGIATSSQQMNTVSGIGNYVESGGTGNYALFRVYNNSTQAMVTMNISWSVTTQGMNGMSLVNNAMSIINDYGDTVSIANPIISVDGGSSTSSVQATFLEYSNLAQLQGNVYDRSYIRLNLDLTGTPSNNGRAGVPDSIYIQHVIVMSDV